MASSPTNINGEHEFIFLFEDHISNPHTSILLKAKTLCLCFKICHTLLFSASGSNMITFHPYQSHKNMQSLIS